MFSKPYLWVSHCFSWCSVWHVEERAKFIHPSSGEKGGSGREKKKMYVFETERETEMDRQDKEDGKVERDWQAWERDGWLGRQRGRERQTDRLTTCHELSAATPSPFSTLFHISFLSLTADDNPQPVSASVTSITQGPDTVITLWAPYQASTLLCVCVYVCVYLIGYVTPCWGERMRMYVYTQAAVCVTAIWQAGLLEKSLSDCRSIWGKPMD